MHAPLWGGPKKQSNRPNRDLIKKTLARPENFPIVFRPGQGHCVQIPIWSV